MSNFGRSYTVPSQLQTFNGSLTTDGAMPYSNVQGTPTLSTVATSGGYADLSSKPYLDKVASTGSYFDVHGAPPTTYAKNQNNMGSPYMLLNSMYGSISQDGNLISLGNTNLSMVAMT